MLDVEKRFRNPNGPIPLKSKPSPASTRSSVRPTRLLKNVASTTRPTAINGVRKSQRNIVIPTGMELPFAMGSHPGSVRPRCRNVEAAANKTNTETIPFQNKQKSSSANAWPTERWVAAITTLLPSRRNQQPAGGLVTSTFSSTAVPIVRPDNRQERLQFRQNAMSFATLTSSLGMICLQRGHIGVTASAEINFSKTFVIRMNLFKIRCPARDERAICVP